MPSTPSPVMSESAPEKSLAGNRNIRPVEKTPALTESVVTAAAPDLKPAPGHTVQAHAGHHAQSLPVAQVAPTPRVVPRETFHVTPIVDQNGIHDS